MSTLFPGAIDTPVNPSAGSTVTAVDHAGQHTNTNDAIVALETKVGATGSAVTSTIDYKLSGVTAADKAVSKTGIETLTNKTLTAPVIASIVNTGTLTLPTSNDTLVGRATTDTFTNKTLTAPIIGDFSSASHSHQNAVGAGSLDAASIATGTFTGARLGSGTANSTTYLRGDLTWQAAASGIPPGALSAFAMASAPAGWLTCDGTAISRSTYATLFAALSTIWGAGDGSTTFNVPDLRGRSIVGAGTGTKIGTITSVAGNIATLTGLASASNNEFQTGQAVVFGASVAGNLVNATTYYVVRVTNTTISLATSLANAQNGALITLAGTERGTLTLSLSVRTTGDTGGEENHAMSSTELLAHTHSIQVQAGTSSGTLAKSANNVGSPAIATDSTGGNNSMNIMTPFGVGFWCIKT